MDAAELAQIDELSYDAAVLLWISMFMTGVLLWELVTQLPADIKYVLYPEFRRSILPRPLATLALGPAAATRRDQHWWQRAREKRAWPHLPAICLFLARLFTIPCCAVTLAFCRRTSNCTATARAYVACVSLASVNCQCLFTLRASAIVGGAAKNKVIYVLWLGNAVVCALWMWFLASTHVNNLPRPVPDLKMGFVCDQPQVKSELIIVIYALSFVLDVALVIITFKAIIPVKKTRGQLQQKVRTHFHRAEEGDAVPALKARPEGTLRSLGKLSYITRRFLTDVIKYFLIAVAIETFAIVWASIYLAGPKDRYNALRATLILCLHSFLGYVIGPRCVTALKRAGRNPNAGLASLEMSSQSLGSSSDGAKRTAMSNSQGGVILPPAPAPRAGDMPPRPRSAGLEPSTLPHDPLENDFYYPHSPGHSAMNANASPGQALQKAPQEPSSKDSTEELKIMPTSSDGEVPHPQEDPSMASLDYPPQANPQRNMFGISVTTTVQHQYS